VLNVKLGKASQVLEWNPPPNHPVPAGQPSGPFPICKQKPSPVAGGTFQPQSAVVAFLFGPHQPAGFPKLRRWAVADGVGPGNSIGSPPLTSHDDIGPTSASGMEAGTIKGVRTDIFRYNRKAR